MGTGTFSLKNSKIFSGLKVPVPIVAPITTHVLMSLSLSYPV